jgi:hypothetical protein
MLSMTLTAGTALLILQLRPSGDFSPSLVQHAQNFFPRISSAALECCVEMCFYILNNHAARLLSRGRVPSPYRLHFFSAAAAAGVA